jgi:excinuclease UvrABC nuclease subunit
MDREQTMRELEQQAAQAVQDGDLEKVAELREAWNAVRYASEATRG